MGSFNTFGRGRNDRGSRSGRSFGGERHFNSGRGGDRPKQLFQATCDKCGKQCSVPFKPTGSRPVYCKECFGGQQNGNAAFGQKSYNRGFSEKSHNEYPKASGSVPGSGITKAQFEALSAKIDTILSLLQQSKEMELPNDDLFVEQTEDLAPKKSKKTAKKSKSKKK